MTRGRLDVVGVRMPWVGSLALLLGLAVWACVGGASPAAPDPSTRGVVPPANAGPGSSGTPPPSPVGITVFAASSLTDAFAELAAAYEASHPGVTVTLAYGGSGALRARIEQGARADVFAAADARDPAALVAAGLAHGPPVSFATNELAVVVPASNPAGLIDPYGLAAPGVKIVAAGEAVPITAYATALLENLEAYRGAQADLIPSYERNVVSREDDVRAALAKVVLGEADAAIVYATDARSAGEAVGVLPLPPGTNVRATYAAVVPADAPQPGAAAAFLAWLGGPRAQGILASFGFGVP